MLSQAYLSSIDGVARKRETGKAKRRCMDVDMKEDMTEAKVTEEDTEDRNNWKWKIRCGDPWWEQPKEEDLSSIEKYWFNCCWENTDSKSVKDIFYIFDDVGQLNPKIFLIPGYYTSCQQINQSIKKCIPYNWQSSATYSRRINVTWERGKLKCNTYNAFSPFTNYS